VEKHDVTQLLLRWSNGDRSALDRLTPILYDELRRLAAAHPRRGFQSETIQPTSLVHEAYLRLARRDDLSFQNRAQLFGLAAQVMRTILVDHATSKAAAKRGAGGSAVTLCDNPLHRKPARPYWHYTMHSRPYRGRTSAKRPSSRCAISAG